METIKIGIESFTKEQSCSSCDRYSHSAFIKKIPKGVLPCDYDKNEKLVEVEFSDGRKSWIPLSYFFGKMICNAKQILQLYPDGHTEEIHIVWIDYLKIKRTNYMKLIFKCDFPF